MNTVVVPPRDLIAAILYVGGIIVALIAIDPLSPILLFVSIIILLIAHLIGLNKFVGLGAAFGILAARFLVVLLLGKGWRALVGAVICLLAALLTYVLEARQKSKRQM